MSKENEVKEIDLLELFRLMGNGIKNAFLAVIKAILFLVVFGFRKAHWISIFVIIGVLLGLAFHSFTKSAYSSGMIIQPNGILSTDLIDYLNDLTDICKSHDHLALAHALEITDSSAQKIKTVEAYPYIDVNMDGVGDYIDFENEYNPKDTTQQIIRNRCYLRIQLYESQPKEYLQKGILNYVKKNEYMVQLNQIRKNELYEQIEQTEKEIAKLDSLQNKEYFKEDNSQAVPISTGGYIVYTEKDKKMYYRDKLALIKNKQNLEKEYELIQGPITVIKNMSELAVEENPKLEIIVKFGFWFGIFGFLVLLFTSHYNTIMNLLNK